MPLPTESEALRARVRELAAEIAREGRDHPPTRARAAEVSGRIAAALADLERERTELVALEREVAALSTGAERPTPVPPPAGSAAPPTEGPPTTRRRGASGRAAALGIGIGFFGAVALGFAALRWGPDLFRRASPPPRPGSVLLDVDELTSTPGEADPSAVLELARTHAQLGPEARLASLRAKLHAGGKVDLRPTAVSGDGETLAFTFVGSGQTSAVRVEPRGLLAPRLVPCAAGAKPCPAAVAAPTCRFDDVWKAAEGVGAVAGDTIAVAYELEGGAPAWSLALEGRGRVAVDAQSCRPRPRQRFMPKARSLAAIAGGPNAVDPVGVLAVAREQSGLDPDAALTQLEAWFVPRTGTLDFASPYHPPRVVYTFADPPAAGGAGAARRRSVSLTATGMPVTPSATDADLVAEMPADPVPLPTCTIADVWKALGKRAADGAVAHVRYRAAGGGGRWSLDVDNTAIHGEVDDVECARRRGTPAPSASR